jgi:hypothetical protein
MAYDEMLAERVRDVLEGRPGLEEQRMFGGLAFLINRRMCCGIMSGGLLLRLGAEGVADVLAREPHARPMDFTGKVMRSFVIIEAPGVKTDAQLRHWVERALAVVAPAEPTS